ncbi:hypothetical protein C8J56DRAFT_1042640 [Mycena floridula]|nr:hypothetical protein C8J56DRAFT_1042640 [Mycena floridula]
MDSYIKEDLSQNASPPRAIVNALFSVYLDVQTNTTGYQSKDPPVADIKLEDFFHLVGSLEGLVWTPSQNPTDQDPISILKFSTCGRQVFVLCTAILESILRSEFPLDDHAFTRFDMLMFSSLMPIPNTPEFYNRL